MPRSSLALPLVLGLSVGCGGGGKEPDSETGGRRLDNGIDLPVASASRPWRPPSEGPVPVVEVRSDGGLVVDGAPIGAAGEAARTELRRRLREVAGRMPRQHVNPDLDAGPTIPANPVLVRVDATAPFGSLRVVLETCQHWEVGLTTVDLQVRAAVEGEIAALRVSGPRDLGSLPPGMAWRWTWLVLDEGADLGTLPTPSREAPSAVGLLLPQASEGGPAYTTVVERFESTQALLARLRTLAGASTWGVGLHLPDDAPSWVAVAALDLGLQAGVELWRFPPLAEPPDTW